MNEDCYKSIKQASEALYKEKGSKFIAFAYPVSTEIELKEKLSILKKQHHDARHHCYAYMLGVDQKKFRAVDDGEPSSTAGKPILGQILSNQLTNILIVVVRYFGGTKLGTSGLIRAYKTAASNAIANAEIVNKIVTEIYTIDFDYPLMNKIMKLIKTEKIEQLAQNFNQECKLTIRIRQSESGNLIAKFKEIENVKAEFVKIG